MQWACAQSLEPKAPPMWRQITRTASFAGAVLPLAHFGLGEIAMLTGRTIRWDPVTESILDDPGAAALLGRSYRKPWIL